MWFSSSSRWLRCSWICFLSLVSLLIALASCPYAVQLRDLLLNLLLADVQGLLGSLALGESIASVVSCQQLCHNLQLLLCIPHVFLVAQLYQGINHIPRGTTSTRAGSTSITLTKTGSADAERAAHDSAVGISQRGKGLAKHVDTSLG